MAKKDKTVVVEADESGDAVMVDISEEPNIVFIGKEPWKPLTVIHKADKKVIRLPEDQSAPFYHKKARFIIAHYPQIYKRFKAKGDK
jgi:uncharacterized protein YuzE